MPFTAPDTSIERPAPETILPPSPPPLSTFPSDFSSAVNIVPAPPAAAVATPASCSRTPLSPSATLFTTTSALQVHGLRCSAAGCMPSSSPMTATAGATVAMASSPLLVAPTIVTSTAGPTIPTPTLAESSVAEEVSSATAITTSPRATRVRRRDLLMEELALWKSNLKGVVGSLFLESSSATSSARPGLPALSPSSSPAPHSALSAARRLVASSSSTSSSTSSFTGPPTPDPATVTPVVTPPTPPPPAPSALTSFHARVLRRKHSRRLVDELFVPLDVDTRVYALPGYSHALAAPPPADGRPSAAPRASTAASTATATATATAATITTPLPTATATLRPASSSSSSSHTHSNSLSGPPPDSDSSDEDDEDDAWNPGYKYWKAQRRRWRRLQYPPPIAPARRVELPADAYPRVYHLLVNEGRRLREPINLADATRILVAGWQASGQWPPQPSMPDPLIAHRKR
ncbi:uncharacterized protein V1518DRAFT_422741 [Limtongia smithiae]|uniref:uncharacterized protein n=1 Tax=Limtongia smithiae TaxID=1125753 RepID=UPI0034CE6FAF